MTSNKVFQDYIGAKDLKTGQHCANHNLKKTNLNQQVTLNGPNVTVLKVANSCTKEFHEKALLRLLSKGRGIEASKLLQLVTYK